MKPINNFLLILVSFFSLCFFYTGALNLSFASQEDISALQQNNPSQIYGKVTNIIKAGNFTYVEVKTDKLIVWAAGPVVPIKIGDMVSFSAIMPMKDFHSKTLNRNFSFIYFTSSYQIDTKTSAGQPTTGQVNQQKTSNSRTESVMDSSVELEVGGYLSDVLLDSLNGQSKSFSVFKGKPMIINIWASWCGPCRSEMGSLERLSHWNSGKDFNIIGISTDDYRDRAGAFIEKTEITFENFIDHQLLLENMFGAKSIPLTILVDAEGRVLKKVRGALKWDSPEILSEIGRIFHFKTSKVEDNVD